MSQDVSGDDLIYDLADEFVSRKQAGESPSISEYCARYPHLAGRIREIFATLSMLESVKSDSGVAEKEAADFPETIGSYRIVREIGRGGMGIVYEAQHAALGRPVALKVLVRRLSGNAHAKARFEREARAVAKLHHTNIVPLFEVGEDEGQSFLAMQLINGISLDQLIGRSEFSSGSFSLPAELQQSTESSRPESSHRLPSRGSSGSGSQHSQRIRSILDIAIQIAGALRYAQEREIIHRDIKPSNILLDESGVAWLTDFGLAKSKDMDEDLTQTGDFVGTLRYMAPERFRGECDERADIYALGLTLYELLTGKEAFESSDRLKLMRMVDECEPVSPRSHDPRIPRDLETIVLKSISRDPASRYKSAKALADDLERFQQDRPIKARRHNVMEQLVRWSRRNKSLAASLSVVGLLLGIIAVGATIMLIHSNSLYRLSEDRGTELQRRLYYSQMNLGGAVASEPVGFEKTVEELTSGWFPEPGKLDHRDWEWYYLRSLLGGEDQVLKGHDKEVWSIQWNPDQTYFASASIDGTVGIWDGRQRKIVKRLSHPKPVWSAQWSPDGNQLATSCDDGNLRIWNVSDWSEAKTIKAHPGHVGAVEWSPDGRRIASTSGDSTARIWDVASGQPLGEPLAHESDSVRGGVWRPDGKMVATTCYPGDTIFLWHVDGSGRLPPKELIGHSGVNCLCWNSTGSLIASAGLDGSVRIWDTASGRQLREFDEHVGETLRMDWSADDKWLVSSSRDGTVRVWDFVNGTSSKTFRTSGGVAMCASWDSEANWLAAGCSDGNIRLWDFKARNSPTVRAHTSRVAAVSWGSDGASVQSMSDNPPIKIWNAENGELTSTRKAVPWDYVHDAKWSPDGNFVAVCVDRGVFVLDPVSGHEAIRLGVERNWGAACWSPDGNRLAINTSIGSVDIRETTTWTRQGTLELDSSAPQVESMAWSPDGSWVAVSNGLGRITICDASTGELYASRDICQLDGEGHTNRRRIVSPRVIQWSPDGTLIAGRFEKEAFAWQPMSGNGLVIFTGHALQIKTLTWHPQGRRLATSSADGTVKIWDSKSGQLALTLSLGKSVECVMWHPDGKRIVAGTVDGRLRMWDASKGYERVAKRKQNRN